MAFQPSRLIMPFGAPGGDTQPQGMLQVLLNHLVFGMDIQTAIEAPRFSTHINQTLLNRTIVNLADYR